MIRSRNLKSESCEIGFKWSICTGAILTVWGYQATGLIPGGHGKLEGISGCVNSSLRQIRVSLPVQNEIYKSAMKFDTRTEGRIKWANRFQ